MQHARTHEHVPDGVSLSFYRVRARVSPIIEKHLLYSWRARILYHRPPPLIASPVPFPPYHPRGPRRPPHITGGHQSIAIVVVTAVSRSLGARTEPFRRRFVQYATGHQNIGTSPPSFNAEHHQQAPSHRHITSRSSPSTPPRTTAAAAAVITDSVIRFSQTHRNDNILHHYNRLRPEALRRRVNIESSTKTGGK